MASGEAAGRTAVALALRWSRFDLAAVAAAALLIFLRWGDRARWLFSWDANTFAIALTDYNVRGLHPHAPGYPLYVALGRLFHVVWPSANDALVALSLAFTALSAVLLYRLALRLAGRAVALASLALLLAAPLVYVHSVTANVYTADLACSLAVALAAWRCREEPNRNRVLVLAVVFALAVGIRPSIVMFLAPLVAWAALRPPWTLREQLERLGPGAAVGALVCLAWFIPMVMASGGLAGWMEANRLQTNQVVFGSTAFTHGWPVLSANLARLALFLRWELLWVVPPLAGLLALRFVARRSAPSAPNETPEPRRAFLAVWVVPSLLFYALIFDGWNEGPSGYALIALPGLLLAALLAARWALAPLWRHLPVAAAALALVALAIPTTALVLNAHDVADVRYREHDAWADAWSHLPESFPATNSSIVAFYNFAFVWANFPDYTSYNYRQAGKGPGEIPDFLLIQEAKGRKATPDWYDAIAERRTAGPHPLPAGTQNLVLFDFQLAGENNGERAVRPEIAVREAFLPSGWRVLVVDTTADRPLLEDYFTLDGAAGGPA